MIRMIDVESWQNFLKYTWIEECLKAGKCIPTDPYVLKIPSENESLSQHSIEDSELRASPSRQELGSPKRAKTSDWMQIIKEGSQIGVVPSRPKASRKKEGELCLMLISNETRLLNGAFLLSCYSKGFV